MGCAALLDMDFVNAEMVGKALRLDQRRVAFAERNNVSFFKFRKDDFFLGPNTTQVAQTGIEKMLPLPGGSLLQRVDVMLHLEQTATRLASVNNLVEPVLNRAAGEALKPRVELHESRSGYSSRRFNLGQWN